MEVEEINSVGSEFCIWDFRDDANRVHANVVLVASQAVPPVVTTIVQDDGL